MNFIPDWESEIVIQSGLQTNCQKLMLLHKNESSLEKKSFPRGFSFSSKSKSGKEKESLQGKCSDTKFRYQMLPWIPFKVI